MSRYITVETPPGPLNPVPSDSRQGVHLFHKCLIQSCLVEMNKEFLLKTDIQNLLVLSRAQGCNIFMFVLQTPSTEHKTSTSNHLLVPWDHIC